MSIITEFFNSFNQMIRGDITVIGGKPYLLVMIGNQKFIVIDRIDYDQRNVEFIGYPQFHFFNNHTSENLYIITKSNRKVVTNLIVASFSLGYADNIQFSGDK